MDNEDEILKKAPFLEREQVKVCHPVYMAIIRTSLESNAVIRDGRASLARMGAGLQLQRRSMRSERS